MYWVTYNLYIPWPDTKLGRNCHEYYNTTLKFYRCHTIGEWFKKDWLYVTRAVMTALRLRPRAVERPRAIKLILWCKVRILL
jgi:hypothetical protein